MLHVTLWERYKFHNKYFHYLRAPRRNKISGSLETFTTGIYLNGAKIDDLEDGQTSLFYGLSGTNRISVDNAIYISNDTRLYCPNQSITVNFDGNFTFQYKRQYHLQISIEPQGGGTTTPESVITVGVHYHESGLESNCDEGSVHIGYEGY